METIYQSLSAHVAVGTFFSKSPVSYRYSYIVILIQEQIIISLNRYYYQFMERIDRKVESTYTKSLASRGLISVTINSYFYYISSPGEKGVVAEEGVAPHPGYPAFAPCSQSPGGTWNNNVAGAYIPHPSPSAVPGGQGTPQGTPQQGTPQAPLPSPLYPWMRSQFGRFTWNRNNKFFF